MTTTLNEIATHRAHLHGEIMERECLLAALDVFEKYAASGHAPRSIELGSLVSTLLPSRSAIEVKELPTSAAAPPAAAALPPKPPVERYMHPELKIACGTFQGSYTRCVQWAINRMTEDYSLHDISALLLREGAPLGSSKISVVLSRMKGRGEIEEIRRGEGPIPALFRKPERVTDDVTNPADETIEMASPTLSGTAA
ncbi:MAG: hypothetical protein ABI787_03045 [Spartobacteria bacterium]